MNFPLEEDQFNNVVKKYDEKFNDDSFIFIMGKLRGFKISINVEDYTKVGSIKQVNEVKEYYEKYVTDLSNKYPTGIKTVFQAPLRVWIDLEL